MGLDVKPLLRAVCLFAAVAGGTLATATAQGPAQPAAVTAAGAEFFEKQIRPLLVKHCYECHGPESDPAEGGLRLDTRQGLTQGGKSGAVVIPRDPDQSRLIVAVRYADPLVQMPPDGKLSAREIDALAEWVRMGAPDPRDASGPPPAPISTSLSEERLKWWSFQPVRDPAVPPVRDGSWPLNEIDCFILAKLESSGMRPAPAADKRTLIRRATFDLTGLPPTPEEVDAFLADESPTAFASVVDRLLASRHYGERWGRHWLDVVRYADTSGCNGDFPIPQAYRYRNYVIDSFNEDKPYDQFLREQIAGDLLPSCSEEERYEQIVATGYLAISRRFSSVAEEFHLTLDDTIDNFGKAMLGLSVSCARCHEHKFDPIPQEDYYALHGIFESTKYAFPGTEIYRHQQDLTPLVPRERIERELRPFLERMVELDAEILRTYSPVETLDAGKEKDALKAKVKKLQAERDELLKKLPEFPKAFAASEGTPVDSHVQIKGDPKNLGSEVPRRFLQVLGGQRLPPEEKGSGRVQLAAWVTAPANPLTARVMVNRVWLHHFGQGIVRTPDDFGTRGAVPAYTELLDWLATRFAESGWSIKSLHRRIMFSRAYQVASIENADYRRRDPSNELQWTFNRRRLSAEELRDAILAVSGALDRSPGGPHPFIPELEWRYTQHKPFVDDFPSNRRSV
ncbi:MAG: DUF1549 domain-containing protein, partial [Planctomycetes bacterium]|nr:DUF1549 domain-containing protein [Planctomycetota bacterium]